MTTLALFPSDAAQLVDSTDVQNTPRDLARELGCFDLDVCSNPVAHIQATRSFMLEHGEDGLALPWVGSVWCNGPYSDPLPWCERLRAHDGPWCALWKLDTTTAWWRQLMASGASWAAFRDRLGFERDGQTSKALFVSVLVWKRWRPSPAVLQRLWNPRRET